MAEIGERPRTFGQRVRQARERRGLPRPVVAGLVGRSAEWVKAVENDKVAMPRLPLLLRLAETLGVDDLASLTGDERLSVATYTMGAHSSLARVRAALTDYDLDVAARDEEPSSSAALADRVTSAWQAWHGAGEHRSRVADLLPALLTDLQHAARTHEGTERRRALVLMAQVYHLAQLYLSFQPAPDLLMLTSDRAMKAAQDADSPRAVAAAVWYLNHLFRDAGERADARVDIAMQAVRLLDQDRGPDDIALSGLLHLAAALSYAKVGRKGDAERHWDTSAAAAARLGTAYTHPWLIFGHGMVNAYAITMNTDLVRAGAAVDAAMHIDLAAMPSATRRSFHTIETARAHSLQGETIAVVHLLKRAYEISPETATFNIFARGTAADLAETGSTIIRDEARGLARQLGVAA
ncbi:multiprotein-bridging factor 1 family protein [Streptomyces chrestomyceticus]|uniref:multiprotein-bridging factor 1 family protein n=1 Tax=Streptomyces chrestomyceticus TaxID=68185 RepID=UPI00379C7F9A